MNNPEINSNIDQVDTNKIQSKFLEIKKGLHSKETLNDLKWFLEQKSKGNTEFDESTQDLFDVLSSSYEGYSDQEISGLIDLLSV